MRERFQQSKPRNLSKIEKNALKHQKLESFEVFTIFGVIFGSFWCL